MNNYKTTSTSTRAIDQLEQIAPAKAEEVRGKAREAVDLSHREWASNLSKKLEELASAELQKLQREYQEALEQKLKSEEAVRQQLQQENSLRRQLQQESATEQAPAPVAFNFNLSGETLKKSSFVFDFGDNSTSTASTINHAARLKDSIERRSNKQDTIRVPTVPQCTTRPPSHSEQAAALSHPTNTGTRSTTETDTTDSAGGLTDSTATPPETHHNSGFPVPLGGSSIFALMSSKSEASDEDDDDDDEAELSADSPCRDTHRSPATAPSRVVASPEVVSAVAAHAVDSQAITLGAAALKKHAEVANAWQIRYDKKGRPVYFNRVTGYFTWNHPSYNIATGQMTWLLVQDAPVAVAQEQVNHAMVRSPFWRDDVPQQLDVYFHVPSDLPFESFRDELPRDIYEEIVKTNMRKQLEMAVTVKFRVLVKKDPPASHCLSAWIDLANGHVPPELIVRLRQLVIVLGDNVHFQSPEKLQDSSLVSLLETPLEKLWQMHQSTVANLSLLTVAPTKTWTEAPKVRGRSRPSLELFEPHMSEMSSPSGRVGGKRSFQDATVDNATPDAKRARAAAGNSANSRQSKSGSRNKKSRGGRAGQGHGSPPPSIGGRGRGGGWGRGGGCHQNNSGRPSL